MWQTDVSPIWNSVMWLDKMNLLSPIGDNKFIENYSEWGNCCTQKKKNQENHPPMDPQTLK